VQVLALQQQLRDDGCGVQHTTGTMNAQTRAALKRCASKYNAKSNTVADVLAAMNIGFGPSDQVPALAGTGISGSASSGAMTNPTDTQTPMVTPAVTGDAAATGMTTPKKHTKSKTAHKRGKMMRDSAAVHDSVARDSATTTAPSTPTP